MATRTDEAVTGARPGPLDRLLGVFSDVRPGEGARALLMLLNVFLILVSYYIIKTVREPLILTTEIPEFLQTLGIKGPAEVKAYAAAGQAVVLMIFVPAYSWFASRVDRMKLVLGVTAFFVANILAFALAVGADKAILLETDGSEWEPMATAHAIVEARHRELAVAPGRTVRSFPRPALHAWRLGFTHPRTLARMRFEAPLAEDMRVLWLALAGSDPTLPADQV